MKSSQAAKKLPVRAPLRDHKGKGPSAAPSRSQSSQKPLRPAPTLTDTHPLSLKRTTTSSPGKPRPIGSHQRSLPDLRKKSSAPGLRRRKLPVDGTDNKNSPRRPSALILGVKNKMSAPDMRRISASQLYGIASCPPMEDLFPDLYPGNTAMTPPPGDNDNDLPDMGRPSTSQISSRGSCPSSRSRLSSPYSPGPSRRINPMAPPPDDSDDDPPDPRFMVFHEGRRAADTVPDEIVPFKMPTITGMAPSQVRRTKWPVKQVKPVTPVTPVKSVKSVKVPERSVKKLTKVLKRKNFKARCKDVSKQFTRKKMFIHAHSCVRAFRAVSRRKALDIPARPVYRLKEKRRASTMFGMPNLPRLPSNKSLKTLAAVDIPKDSESEEKKDTGLVKKVCHYRRDSDTSVYSKASKLNQLLSAIPQEQSGSNGPAVRESRYDDLKTRLSRSPYEDWMSILEESGNPFYSDGFNEGVTPSGNPHDPTASLPDDSTLRSSLLSFREWIRIFDSHRDSLNLENHRESLIVPPFVRRGSTLLHCPTPSGGHRTPHPDSTSLNSTRRSVTEVKTSDNTHSPQSQSSVVFSNTTDPMASSAPQDPFTDHPVEEEGLTQLESQVFAYRQDTTRELSDRPPSTASSQETMQASKLNPPQKDWKEMLSKQRPDAGSSKIPRVTTQKRRVSAQQAESTPEQPSSIPISVRKRGERPQSPQEESSHRFSGGIRVIEKPVTFHRLATELNPPHEPEPAQPVSEEEDSSSVSSWGNIDPAELAMKKPKGLTGENRVRPQTREDLLAKYGASLRIAPSAERLLLGKDTDTPESQRSSSLKDKQADRSLMSMPNIKLNESRHFEEGQEYPFPNFCRPQVPQETYPRSSGRSHREIGIYHNTRTTSLNLETSNDDDNSRVPPVPRVPSRLKESRHGMPNRAMTPPVGTDEYYAEMASRVDPFTLSGPLDSHPPRSTSLQAQAGSDFTPSSLREAKPSDNPPKPDRSNRTFDEIMQEPEDSGRKGSSGRLPDSKSSRMLGGFRNIFSKNKTGQTNKEQSAGSDTKHAKSVTEKTESAPESAKSKTKWSKSSRNLRPEHVSSPMLTSAVPSPGSYSSAARPPARRQEIHTTPTPSFARPTQATRTRQAASAVAQEARMNRIKVLTPSTGSPSRSARIQKRTNHSESAPQPQDIQSDPRGPWDLSAPSHPKFADCGEVGIESVQSCIESLCVKACENSHPLRRQKNLRLALDLQQQLSDYKSVAKEAKDLEALLSQKKTEKGLALNTLMQYLDMVRMQIEEI